MKKNTYRSKRWVAFLLSFFIFTSANIHASVDDNPCFESKSYVMKKSKHDYSDLEKFRSDIVEICSDPKAVILDFSLADLNDEDLDFIFLGLLRREVRSKEEGGLCLKLLDINCEGITNNGLERFLSKIEQGGQVESEGPFVYGDVRGTIMHVGYNVSLTESYLDSLMKTIAPKTFAGSLQIIE
ncbi:MAG: hypothetical protein EBT45_04800 [Alphaproteobacteria bacterium]|nr:hypothetical protein [Alphaproteobacteria bacterium]